MDVFGVRSLPYLARRNYYYEILHLIPWGILVGTIEGNAASIVVAKTFDGSDFLVAAASATPIGTLLFSWVWGMLCVGRAKLRLATIFGSGAALCAATVCLTPQTPAGGVLFVLQMAAAQVCLSGVVTVRASLWKHNYPPEARGMIAARLQAVRLILSIAVVVLVSALFDFDPGLYRYVYPTVAVSGAVAIIVLQNVHVRHEKTELSVAANGAAAAEGPASRISVRDSLSPRFVARGMWAILRQDRRYARYLVSQMLFGVGVQAVIPVLVVVISGAVELYIINSFLIELLPKLLMFSSLRRWGRFFDRVGVNRFRVFTGSCAAAGVLVGMAATILVMRGAESGAGMMSTAALVLFVIRGILHGLHQGGGTLAWNLGHLHFAKRHEAEKYMALHQALTGVRGLITPFVGIALWVWIGWGVWVVSFVLCVAGVVGFFRLAAEESSVHRPV